MTESLRVAVLGAGYVGAELARTLAAGGAQVVAVRRRAVAPEPGIQWLAADLGAPLPLSLPRELDAIVLAVAPGGTRDSYAATYPPAAAAALALAHRTGARRVIYTSSTGVYGGEEGELITEASPRRGSGPGNGSLIEAEDRLLDAGQSGVTVLRVAGIYGPGRDPRARFLESAALPMRGEYWVNLAHRSDIVRGIQQVLQYDGPPRALNLADGAPAQAADIARWLAAARGADPARLTFGNEAMRSRSNQRIDSSALQAEGWVPRFPSFREGFADGL